MAEGKFVLEGDDGKYTIPGKEDFTSFKAECENDDGWTPFSDNDKFKMWTKKVRILIDCCMPRRPKALRFVSLFA